MLICANFVCKSLIYNPTVNALFSFCYASEAHAGEQHTESVERHGFFYGTKIDEFLADLCRSEELYLLTLRIFGWYVEEDGSVFA